LKRFNLKISFRGKIYAGIIAIILLCGLLMAFSVRTIVAKALSEEYRQRGITIAENLAARSEDPMLAVDFLRMKDLIDKVFYSSDDIEYAFMLDQNSRILSHTFQEGFPVELKRANFVSNDQDYNIKLLDTGQNLIYDVAAPVFVADHRLGTVWLGLSKTKVKQTIKNLLSMIFLLTGMATLIAGFVGAGFANQVTKRIKKLRQASEQALSGNLDIQTAPLLKKNCWEIMRCNKKKCPAYGDKYRRCWYLAGTMCPNCVDGEYAKKIISCRTCEVYSRLSGDEIQEMAEAFDAMALTLKNNITQLKQSAETIEKSEKKYRRIFEGSIDLIFIADNHGRFIDINQAGIEMLGHDTREDFLQSVNLADFFVKSEHYKNILNELSSKGFIKDREYKLKTKNDCELQVLFSGTAQKDRTGQFITLEGTIKDITLWKDMKQQLLQADKLASLGQLSAGVAHEINNPLGLILGYTQLLMRGESEGRQVSEDLKTIEKQARNCKMIIEALLNFARKTETQKIVININQTIKNIVAVIRHQFELDNVNLVTKLDETIQPVMGDNEKLKQVIMNLLMNAKQAISESGDITIMTFEPNHNRVCIIIEDSGSGIPANIINKIFDPFFTTKPTGLGTGLGLSVSYGIVEEHKGKISVQSKEGKGTTFKVELPVYRNDLTKIQTP